MACSSYCHVARSPEDAVLGGGFHSALRTALDVSRGDNDIESVSEYVEGDSMCEDEVLFFGYEDEHGVAESVGLCRKLSEHLGEGSIALMQALGELGEGPIESTFATHIMFTMQATTQLARDTSDAGNPTDSGLEPAHADGGFSTEPNRATLGFDALPEDATEVFGLFAGDADLCGLREGASRDTATTNDSLYRGMRAAKLAYP